MATENNIYGPLSKELFELQMEEAKWTIQDPNERPPGTSYLGRKSGDPSPDPSLRPVSSSTLVKFFG